MFFFFSPFLSTAELFVADVALLRRDEHPPSPVQGGAQFIICLFIIVDLCEFVGWNVVYHAIKLTSLLLLCARI